LKRQRKSEKNARSKLKKYFLQRHHRRGNSNPLQLIGQLATNLWAGIKPRAFTTGSD